MPRLYELLEQLDRDLDKVEYIIGVAKNPKLLERAKSWMTRAEKRCERTQERARLYGHIRYAAKTWKRKRLLFPRLPGHLRYAAWGSSSIAIS